MGEKIGIDEIEIYFNTFGYPYVTIEILQGVTVSTKNAELFVTNSLICLRAHSGNKAYMPYFLHLAKYYQLVKLINK